MSAPLRILHLLRSPVGGLFRHVLDLARGQAARGHAVGIVADASTGGADADRRLADIAPQMGLGISRIAMSRDLGLSDLAALRHIAARAYDSGAQVLHGHGAKGGAYARLARAASGTLRAYTPHGGSLHYQPTSPVGLLYLSAERLMARRTGLFLFESGYGRDTFVAKIGEPDAPTFVVHNGVRPEEFEPIDPATDAADIVFVGELRTLKGVDILIEALALLAEGGRPLSAVIVGEGPDGAAFRQLATSRGVAGRVRVAGALPARAAFALGRVLAVPSRAESLPYIVLEACAAGVPVVATRVGGIPEIFGEAADRLVPPGDPAALMTALRAAVTDPDPAAVAELRGRVRARFSVDAMVNGVLDAYRSVKDSDFG